GLAQPVSVVGPLLTPEMKKHGLSIQIVSTFDYRRNMALLQHDRQFQAQLAAAQRIVLTKRDLVADPETAAMVECLGAVGASHSDVRVTSYTLNGASGRQPPGLHLAGRGSGAF